MRSSSKLLLTFGLAALAPAVAHAQTHAVDRGSYLISGTANFITVGGEIDGESVDRQMRIALEPSVQYFILPGLAIGGSVSLVRDGSGDDATTQYGIGPRLTYYFGAGSGAERPWFPYIGAGAQWLKTDLGDADPIADDPSAKGFDVRGGILFMLSPAVGLNSELFYQAERTKGALGIDISANAFGLAVGLSAFLF